METKLLAEEKGKGLGGSERSGEPPNPLRGDEAAPPLPSVADPQVPEKPIRRRFTAEYKQRILQEADGCTEPGQLGALLRREGLYSSHLTTWRKQRDSGVLAGLAPRKRGRKAKPQDPLAEENQRLRRENERLRAKLRQAEAIIEVQKKLAEALGIPPKLSVNEGSGA